jgi:L-malate glycosyltransferase
LHIGIAAPFETSSLSDLIGQESKELPAGYSGAPVIGALVRALIARGHQVTIYTTDHTLLPKQQEPVKFQNKQITIYYCPSRPRSFMHQDGFRGRATDFFAFERKWLVDSIKQDAPDVVHAHWAYEFAWAAMDSGLPHIVTFHDSPLKILYYMPNLYRLLRYFMATRTIKNTKLITTVSPYMQDELLNWAGKKVVLVPNGIEEDWFTLAKDPNTKNLSHPKIAMIVNGWGRRKNAKPALQAFAMIKKKLPLAELHLFGTDFANDEIASKWCNKNGIADGMYFHGKLPYSKLRNVLAEMRLLIHPSLEESFGMTVLEAMALALPVVGGINSGGVPWLLGHGEAGLPVDVKDYTKIANAVLSLLSKPKDYYALANASQAYARKHFLIGDVAEKYEAIYQQAIAQGL